MNNPTLPGDKNALSSPRITADLPPWREQSSWIQIVSFFSYSCRDKKLDKPIRYAAEIARKMAVVDDLLENLCGETCNSCAEPCCQRATIWYDFVDLLFSYLQHEMLPQKQIVKRRGEPCSLLTPMGCVLPRIERPFICTWYICPVQSGIIDQADKTNELRKVYLFLREIQSTRKSLEDSFIDAVVG